MPSRFIIGKITWYSVLIVLGIGLAIMLATKEEQRKNLPKDIILDIAIAIVPSGIIGARLYYVIFNLEYFLANPQNIFKIWNGGLAIYGGIICGLLACYIVSKYRKTSFLAAVDCIAPGLALAQSIGRWGNFFNQEAYGRAVLESGLQFFPYAVYIQGKGYFMATFFYESLCDFIIFAYLWSNRRSIVKNGDLFLRYLALYGCARAFIEGLRSDSLYIGSIRISQAISALAVLCVLAYFLYRLFKSKRISDIFKQKSLYISIAIFSVSIMLAFLQKNDYFSISFLLGTAVFLENIYNTLKENNK